MAVGSKRKKRQDEAEQEQEEQEEEQEQERVTRSGTRRVGTTAPRAAARKRGKSRAVLATAGATAPTSARRDVTARGSVAGRDQTVLSSSSTSSSTSTSSSSSSSSTVRVGRNHLAPVPPSPKHTGAQMSPVWHEWREYVALSDEPAMHDGVTRQMVIDADPRLRKRNLLADIWQYACGGAIAMYIATCLLFRGYLGVPMETFSDEALRETSGGGDLLSWDRDKAYRDASFVSFVALLVSGFKTCSILFSSSNHLDAARRRGVVYCILTTNAVAAHAHYSIYRGAMPVWLSCHGRPQHAARWAEWIALVCLIVTIMRALDCGDRKEVFRAALVQFVSIVSGMASSMMCQLADGTGHCAQHFDWWDGGGGGGDNDDDDALQCAGAEGHDVGEYGDCRAAAAVSSVEYLSSPPPSSSSSAAWSFRTHVIPNYERRSGAFNWSLVVLGFACVAFFDVFRLFFLAMRSERVHCTTASTQSVLLTCGATLTWSLFVVVYSLGALNLRWFTPYVEASCFTFTDVVAKLIYTEVLGRLHLASMSPGEWYKAQLATKERANQAQRSFIRYVFHEVRVPLNTIQLGLESVMGDVTGLTEDIDDVLESVGEAVSTMSETLDDVLSYQKIEDGRMEVVAHVFDLAALLDQCSTAFAAPCRSKRLRLTMSTDDDVPNGWIVGDALRVRQVLNNFISNAIKFTARGGSIHVCVRTIEAPSEVASPHDHLPPLPSAASSSSSSSSTDSTEDDHVSPCDSVWLEFNVTDSGCGIAADDMRSLFTPFTQIRAGDLQMGRGSGLGLCICKRIIHLFKGRIGVRSSPGSGSCFFFALPFGTTYAPNDATANDRSARAVQSSLLAVGSQQEVLLRQPPSAAADFTGAGGRVLVVDDVSANRKMLKRCVEQLGFQVDTAEDGAEAVQMWQAAYVSSSSSSSSTFSCGPGYVLMLMDNLMPNMTGCEAARKIRELEEEFESSSGSGSGSSKKSSRSRSQEDTKRRTLIIGVTGNALSIDRDEFIEAGCDEVLTKPLKMETLRTVMHNKKLFASPMARAFEA